MRGQGCEHLYFMVYAPISSFLTAPIHLQSLGICHTSQEATGLVISKQSTIMCIRKRGASWLWVIRKRQPAPEAKMVAQKTWSPKKKALVFNWVQLCKAIYVYGSCTHPSVAPWAKEKAMNEYEFIFGSIYVHEPLSGVCIGMQSTHEMNISPITDAVDTGPSKCHYIKYNPGCGCVLIWGQLK